MSRLIQPAGTRRAGADRRQGARPPDSALWPLATLAAWRSAAYRFLAALFLPPEIQRWQGLVALARDLRALNGTLSLFAFFPPWQRLVDLVAASDAEGIARWSTEYARLFLIGRAPAACSPHEASYRGAGEPPGAVVALVARAYARAGVEPARHRPEGPDHVATEMEFLAYLCLHEAAAWDRGDAETARRALAEQRTFLEQHLGCWFATFAANLCATTTELLYMRAAVAAHAFLDHDRELIALLTRDLARQHDEVCTARRAPRKRES